MYQENCSMENGALRSATDEIIEVDVDTLGIAVEHLVRSINDADVYELALKDESKWEPIEIRLWPAEWKKPDPKVLYHVVSGNHRTSAAKIKQLRTLRARLIETDSRLSYYLAAMGSNLGHGKNFTREEYIENAKKLQNEGMSLGDIASFFGYHKSTVSRWLTGNDSHAASKQELASVPTTLPSLPTRAIKPNEKIMGLLMDAQMEADITECQVYVRTLKDTQRGALHSLISWLEEVLNG